jgi:16S rRNA processing protein RimM
VRKPHGLKGEVVVTLVSNRPERTLPGAVLRGGDRDLRIVSARPVPGAPGRYVMRFDGVVDRDGAERLRDTVLRAEPIDDPDALWVDDLIGCELVDEAGTVLGTVVALVSNPAGDLLELQGGGLVPLRFVVAHAPGRVAVADLPAGLID